MPIVGLDDTDSRERGMCTTFVAARIGERLEEANFDVRRHLLVRCNPAVEHKTRGNAALALHVEDSGRIESDDHATDRATRCFQIARETTGDFATTAGGDANPGLVVAECAPDDVPDEITAFSETAVRGHHEIDDAVALLEHFDYESAGWGTGRGRIGALAAVGAWTARDEWTYERICYRERSRWGTDRTVECDSVFAAAEPHRSGVWDTVDRESGTAVCVPRTPCPVLFGIRGDDRDAVEAVATGIESEPVERAVTFVTNQGTDAHLRSGEIGALDDGHAYSVDGVVATAPETREGGHVFLDVAAEETNTATEETAEMDAATTGADAAATEAGPVVADRLPCVAFEPTKQFRDRVRALHPGDAVTVCGEIADGTCKLEKFAVRSLVRTEETTPTCPECSRTMESAGADQGYRCRDCETSTDGPATRRIERDLERGWYEVPPVARRHVAKPLVRGGFDAPVHPER